MVDSSAIRFRCTVGTRPFPAATSVVPVLVVLTVGLTARGDSPESLPGHGDAGRPVSIRVTWGGGKARAWSGTIRVVPIDEAGGPAAATDWRTLSGDADAAATLRDADGAIAVADTRPRGGGGVEIVVPDWRRRRCDVRLVPDGDERAAVTLACALADVVAAPLQQPLDRDGNRITIKTAPGDALRVTTAAAAGPAAGTASAVHRPGDVVRVTVESLLPRRAAAHGGVELRLRLKAAPDAEPIVSQALPLVERPAGEAGLTAPARVEEYESVAFDVPLPAREGAYDIDLEAVEKGGLRWSRPLASRTVQVVAITDAPPDPAWRVGAWRVVHELDPGSPRLHERLRRLPATGLSGMPLPKMPLPQMPLPSMTLPSMPMPNVPLPKLPSVPMPGVPLPSVSAMVPRLSGLLAAGDSTVEVHPLGPMLRLPPARSAEEPTWEGIVVAGVQPGVPHLVEVEYPLDQRAIVGVSVLEADAAGTLVEPRANGGFEVAPPPFSAAAPSGLGRHAFVFWPATRNPLVLIANPSSRTAALFGRVRVSAGPARPPASVSRPAAGADGRRVYAYLPEPDFAAFGAAFRPAAGAGRPFADWRTFLGGATRAAEWTAAQSAAGTVVTAYRDGAAIWPSRLTRDAPRWDSGATAEVALDPSRKDLLAMLCRIHAREGLRLVPALSFDAPLPALEPLVARGGADARGLVLVGRDGRPRRTDGDHGWHYNPLDPRVQAAVEAVVGELAGRLRGVDCVDGVALVLSHDGWLHLPGTAWGLDDATFSRFLAAIGGQEPAALGDRFARRAALVEGPLREQWLEWRAASLAAFHARLAATLAAANSRSSLFVVPTTLLVEGEIAARFRPALAPRPEQADVWREIGLDPGLVTADPRIVFVSPHVHAAADALLDRSLPDEANRSLEVARGLAGAARRGAVILERPLPLSVEHVVPHGPFGNAAVSGPVSIHAVPVGPALGRGLAESLAASDVETVFDMRLSLACVEPAQEQWMRSFAALPAEPLELAEGRLPAPLVVRTKRDGTATVVSVANAGPAACRAVLSLTDSPAAVSDAMDRTRLPLEPAGGAAVPLGPWATRTLVVEGGGAVADVRVEFDDAVRAGIATQLADLRRRRAVLETPRPLDVLDNPGFELAGAGEAAARDGGGVGGWELVEAARGRLGIVPGVDGPSGRALAFSSANGLSTLRSNPFAPPANGRISVAVWLRIADGEQQPPLRLALEGVLDDREYYRFAPVGGLGGGKPLSPTWSQFVLQVDDLPGRGLESLRVRLDLLGPGSVQIDGVRVFDLAFDESQRVQLSRRLAVMEERLAAGDVGACLVELDGYWPRFLAEHVSDEAVAAARDAVARQEGAAQVAPQTTPPRSGSVFDRVRRWWQ